MHTFIVICLVAAATADISGYAYNKGAQIEEVNKEFYTYEAPEAEFAVPEISPQPSVNKKNIQVVFIHAPHQTGLDNALKNLAQQKSEQQTAIYILAKQPDLSQLALPGNDHVSHKPEVHFVRYRTPEDAAHAQRTIQSQYDSLGGTTLNAGESVAPVLNFATQQSSSGSGHAPTQNYLPSLS